MDFIMSLSVSINLKSESYNSILIIINYLIKMIYYELVKVMINASGQVEVIINMVIRHYGIFKSIVTDQSLLFILKF